jgi:electron transport complex protein RnfE
MADKNKRLLYTVWNGIFPQNPIFKLVLGMCPTLAVTKYASQGISMGLATTVVLVFSNLFISVLRNIIQDKIRIPAFIVIIASFVTIVELLIKAFLPYLNETLGIYIPLIVVNCIIFARAESYAYRNPPIHAVMDGLGMGIGFTCALTLLAALREVLTTGTVFDIQVMPVAFPGISIIGSAPGGFIMLGLLLAAVTTISQRIQTYQLARKGEEV